MPSPSFASFAPADSKKWNEAALKELDGKDPLDSLSTQKQNLVIKPYYDTEDTQQISEFLIEPTVNALQGPRGWHNAPLVTVDNEKRANESALHHLNNGADGIIYTINGQHELSALLKGIELPYCSSYFIIKDNTSGIVQQLIELANIKGFDKTQIAGGIFWSKQPQTPHEPLAAFKGWDKFRSLGQIIAVAPQAINEIANALSRGVQIIEASKNSHAAFPHLAFSFTVGSDFFMETAKLKAFRKLWHQVAMAYSVKEEYASPLVHGLSACWNMEKYQPNANMLKSTTSAISCILGGCNLITIEPENENHPLKSRIARNVLTLLREESHLDHPADATAGSYYLEALIEQLAHDAWKLFQKDTAK